MVKHIRIAGHWLLIATLFVSLGGHLSLLQTFAWGNMLVDFSRTTSLKEATSKTFDGDHPCSLCKVVKETRKQDDKKPLLKAESKMEVALPTHVSLKDPVGVAVTVVAPAYFGIPTKVSHGVLLQPPRLV